KGETTEDKLFTLETVACLGCCSLAPVMMINEMTYGRLTTNKVKRIIDDYRKGRAE
ncbi:MAG TPA: NAD(P)H-dependent oxidoreductase subunit E, partial [Spirochaetota bacterium]|nr:NAD(P)H-dependent oxidoreductase subunit E [Spirochaetota bacterium]